MQASLRWAHEPSARSSGNYAAPTDGGGNGGGSPGFGVWSSQARWASAGRREDRVPLPLHVSPPAQRVGQPQLPAASPPGSGPHSPGGPAAGAAPARRARARAPRASCCPDRRGERGPGLRGSELRGAPGRLPRAMSTARLSSARTAGSAGCSPLSTAGLLSARLSSCPLLSSGAPPYHKPTSLLPLQKLAPHTQLARSRVQPQFPPPRTPPPGPPTRASRNAPRPCPALSPPPPAPRGSLALLASCGPGWWSLPAFQLSCSRVAGAGVLPLPRRHRVLRRCPGEGHGGSSWSTVGASLQRPLGVDTELTPGALDSQIRRDHFLGLCRRLGGPEVSGPETNLYSASRFLSTSSHLRLRSAALHEVLETWGLNFKQLDVFRRNCKKKFSSCFCRRQGPSPSELK